MDRKTAGFEGKFLSKIGKIDRRRIRDYLAQLLSRKNFFETVFDNIDEGIVVTDGRLKTVYINAMARQLLAWPRRLQPFGEDLADHCPEGELKSVLVRMRRQPRAIEGYEFPFGEGGRRQLSLASMQAPAPEDRRSADGAVAPGPFWIFILRDVTERRRRIEEQARAQRLASLSTLTSGVAHEIKNPLNSLTLHAQILLQEACGASDSPNGVDRARVERAARVILEESQRLTDIVNEFIQSARPQSPNFETRYLNRVVEDLIPVFSPECEKAGIDLVTDLDPELPPLPVDGALMFQALRNLVRNAIEAHLEAPDLAAAPSDTARPRRAILLRTGVASGRQVIEVADNGPGIPEERLEKIFEPYYTTKSGGTGLGLMVVYRIVTEHGGEIRVDSRPGVGTRFVISLPMDEPPRRLLGRPESAEPPPPTD